MGPISGLITGWKADGATQYSARHFPSTDSLDEFLLRKDSSTAIDQASQPVLMQDAYRFLPIPTVSKTIKRD